MKLFHVVLLSALVAMASAQEPIVGSECASTGPACRECCQTKLEAGTIASDPSCRTFECSPFVVASVPTADTPAPAPESTPAPVPESTPAPVPEPTPAPVPESTPAPAPESTPAPAPESTPAPVPEAPITEASDVAEAPAPALDAAPVLEFATATFVAAAMLVL